MKPALFTLLFASLSLTACQDAQRTSTSNIKVNPNNNATSTTMSAITSANTTSNSDNSSIRYIMPEESQPHEGTWLQWPHHHQYGITYRMNRPDFIGDQLL